jgi:hypothetical protein
VKKIFKWLAPLVTVGVAIFLLFFIISINNDDIEISNEPLGLQTDTNNSKPKKSWLNHFSKVEKEGYFYPVNEVYLQVDLQEKITKTITYKLSANIQDPYQLFCLQEELKRYNLKYFLRKEKRGIDLFIYSQNVDKLNKLIQVLKNYKIFAHIEQYKEEYK